MGGFFHPAGAQPCTLGNPGVKLNYSITEGANCKIGIDLYFDLKHNPGGKWFWVHIWPTSAYSNWSYNNPPTIANGGLTGSIATFGVEHQGTDLVVQTSYPPDNTVPGFQYEGLIVTEATSSVTGAERYTVKNLVLIVPGGCNIPQSFTADVWESQSAASQNVHCFVKGMVFYANDPRATGFINCVVPRTYAFTISTISNADMTADYKVFIDNGDGIFNKTDDNIQVSSGTALLNAANSYRYASGSLSYLPYSGQKPYADRDLWVEVTTAAVPNAVYAHIPNTCIPLPVQLNSFTAARKDNRVELKWTTAAEINNKGFYVERKTGNNEWDRITFVSSAAAGGNSSVMIDYLYNDFNDNSTVTQYRLCQVDLDNKITYSYTRLVKGMGQPGKLLVYPNPSPDGRLVVVLNEMDRENILRLVDMNGKLVKEWMNLPDGQLTIMNLSSGTYVLRVWNKYSNDTQQVKVIISK